MVGSKVTLEKRATSIRLTPEALRLLASLAEELGVTQSSVMEIAIRQMAYRKGVE